MANNIQQFAEEHGTRLVNLGPHPQDDIYLAFGQYWGPGVVEVPNNIADHLEPQVRLVQLERPKEARIDPSVTNQPRNVSLSAATDDELVAALEERRRLKDAERASGHLRPEEDAVLTPEEVAAEADKIAKAAMKSAAEATKAAAKADSDAAAKKKADDDERARIMQQASAAPAAPAAPTANTPPPA